MNNKEIISLPAVALRGILVFPNNVLTFDIGRDKSKHAIMKAIENDQNIFLVGQKDYETEEPDQKKLYSVGVVAEISQTMKVKDGNIRVVVNGIYRAKIVKITDNKSFLEAEVVKSPEREVRLKDKTESGAVIRTVQSLYSEYNEIAGGLPKEVSMRIMTSEDIKFLSEYIPSHIIFRYEDKQRILEESNCLKRLRMICELLDHEINVLDLENEILGKVRTSLDKNQRDYMLREQMHIIAHELGEDDNPLDESASYEARVNNLPIPETPKKKLLEECRKFARMPYSSHEASVIRSYLDYVLSLPFGVKTKDNTDIVKAAKKLDSDHYGLNNVKERILETIAVKTLSGGKSRNIICLVGPPGVGKTSIAKSIAEAMGKKYVRVALGGVHDEAEIRGHRKTYVGSMPGKIIAAIKTAATVNPLILLDEIDKLSGDYKGDPSSALLEVLDSEQNFSFTDNYLEIPFDLSEVMFVTTANDYSSIPRPLLDRMEIIEIEGYTREEKFMIAKRHLVKNELKEIGLKSGYIKFTDDALYSMIDNYTREAGVRELSRIIASVIRKCAKRFCEGESVRIVVKKSDLPGFLGAVKYISDELFPQNESGIASGLAWTEAGGEVLPVEALVLPGSGKTVFTGKLGEVFRESCEASISYIRSISDKLGIPDKFYKESDIHIHAPEGAVPKDGPSAGVTIITAIVSALTGIPVRNDIAMTGEITLKGRVLPIGGLSQKAMAAHRLGVKTVIIPDKNRKDLETVDKRVKDEIEFIFCSYVDEVIEFALTSSPYKHNKSEESINIGAPKIKNGAYLAH